MTDFFTELFEYSYHYNQQYIQLLMQNPKAASEKCLKLINHIVNAQAIWNSRLDKRLTAPGVWSIQELDLVKAADKANVDNSIRILKQVPLDLVIAYTNSQGQAYNNSCRDILFHVVNHSTYHRAQIASDLKANGITPPISDYIFYKRVN